MKSKENFERTVTELQAIDSTYDILRRLGYGPSKNTWKQYCKAVDTELSKLLQAEDEFFEETTMAVDYRDYDAVIEKCIKNAHIARKAGGYQD
jgi:hypothetical protein